MESIGSPKKFNLFELGAGNGEMMKVIVETLKNFPECFENCKFYIHEKSKLLTKQQQINLSSENIEWIHNIKKINSNPAIFLANEFFDALPIKQFFKKKEGWFERYVNFKEIKKAVFKEQIINIEDIYRVIYVQNSNMTTALRVADLEIPISDEKEVILEFITNSTKGIMRGLS